MTIFPLGGVRTGAADREASSCNASQLPRVLFVSCFFAVWSPSSLNGTQPYPVTWSEASVIWKHMSNIWGIPSP